MGWLDAQVFIVSPDGHVTKLKSQKHGLHSPLVHSNPYETSINLGQKQYATFTLKSNELLTVYIRAK